MGTHLESGGRRQARGGIQSARAHARSRAYEGLWPGEKGDLRLGRQLARLAARPRARPAARGGILGGLPRGRGRVPAKAQAELQRKVNLAQKAGMKLERSEERSCRERV